MTKQPDREPVAFVRTKRGFEPANQVALDALRYIKIGDIIRIDVAKMLPRNFRRLNKWWKLCELVMDAIDADLTKEDVSDYLKIKLGHCTRVNYPDGSYVDKPDSIAFAKMNEIDFCQLLDRAIQVVTINLVLDMPESHLRHELELITGMRSAA